MPARAAPTAISRPASKRETDLPAPLSPYGAAKLAAEFYCQAFTHTHGFETVTIRYFNVFGPRQDPNSQYSAVIPLFITAMLAGRQPTVYGDGGQSRDFTYIDNVVHGNLLAAETPNLAGKVLQCGQRSEHLAVGTALGAESAAGNEDRADLRSAPRRRRAGKPGRHLASPAAVGL